MTDNSCIFCKIANKEIKTKIIFETEDLVAFQDVNPQAPVHALIIPKKHYESLNEIDDTELIGKLVIAGREVAHKLEIGKGYRLVLNTGKEAGQAVLHIHFHVLGGRHMLWPPG